MNTHPRMLYVEDLRKFNERTDLPDCLYNLDILDGSPPCSTFSMNGRREKYWGREKMFKEGQARQKLDDLVFVYCETIKKLRPKTFILENVSGLLKGNAKAYAHRIVQYVKSYGYDVQLFLLNAATMGVPQIRQRAFFIGRREELKWNDLQMDFKEPDVCFGEIFDRNDRKCDLTDECYAKWKMRKPSDNGFGDINKRLIGKENRHSTCLIKQNKVAYTIVTSKHILFDVPRYMNKKEIIQASSFPLDYNFNGQDYVFYCGMCVPPVMTAQIAHQMDLQWFQNYDSD